jgi:ribokinase
VSGGITIIGNTPTWTSWSATCDLPEPGTERVGVLGLPRLGGSAGNLALRCRAEISDHPGQQSRDDASVPILEAELQVRR